MPVAESQLNVNRAASARLRFVRRLVQPRGIDRRGHDWEVAEDHLMERRDVERGERHGMRRRRLAASRDRSLRRRAPR